MSDFVGSIWKSITGFFSKLEKKEKIRLAILAAVIIVLAIVVAVILNRTTYATLYSGLDAATAGEVITELDGMGVPYKTEGTGVILVPEEQVSRVRMQLASMGYLSEGFDYSIFGLGEGFGTTDLEKYTYKIYQLEYDVAKQLTTMEKIKSCLVKINLPETSSFVLSNNTQEASASVTLELVSGAVLSDSEVSAIAYTVSGGTSIPPENVYIVDRNANLYRVGDGSSGSTALAYQLELENQVRQKLETQVVNLLSAVFGEGRVKASVAVALSFDKETVQSVEFAPPVEGETEGLVISMSEVYEYTRDEAEGGVVGTDVNGIGTVEYPYDDNESDYAYRHIAREFNYEINETVTQLEKAQATVKSLSLAVLIDSGAIDADYTENVRNLVVNAIGVNDNYVSVERLPFESGSEDYAAAIEAQEEAAREARSAEIMKLVIRGAVIVLLGVMVLLFALSLIRSITRKDEPALIGEGIPLEPIGGGVDYAADGDLTEDIFQRAEDEADIGLKDDNIAQLEKFIDRDSKSIAQLLRNWLSDEE